MDTSLTTFLQPVDNVIENINSNKFVLTIILFFLGIYAVSYNEYISTKAIDLFSNDGFRLIIFLITTYVASTSPALGISLAIIMLSSMQIISNIKLKKDLKNMENFDPVPNSDNSYEYLSNPLETDDNKEPALFWNEQSELTHLNDLYTSMIKKGKNLLDESHDLEQDLTDRYDKREKSIMETTKNTGNVLISSGMNRLYKSYRSRKNNVPTSMDMDMDKDIDSYEKLKSNYELLIKHKDDDQKFTEILQEIKTIGL